MSGSPWRISIDISRLMCYTSVCVCRVSGSFGFSLAGQRRSLSARTFKCSGLRYILALSGHLCFWCFEICDTFAETGRCELPVSITSGVGHFATGPNWIMEVVERSGTDILYQKIIFCSHCGCFAL